MLYDGDDDCKMVLAVGIGAMWMECECSHHRWPASGVLVALVSRPLYLLRK